MATAPLNTKTNRRTATPPRLRRFARVRAISTAIGRPCWFGAKLLLPVLILLGLGLAGVYVRLLNGPISLQMLANPISRSIAAELPGIKVVIEDALVRLTDTGSIEFRLRNVRFTDIDAAPIALAPLAAVSMSVSALLSGRLAPDKVVLIEPRLLLVYGEGGVSVSFSRPTAAVGGPESSGSGGGPAKLVPEVELPEPDDALAALHSIDLAGLIATATKRARKGDSSSSFLRQIGVRNATVVLDRSGRQTLWTVIEGDIDLEHKKRRSIVSGALTIASVAGPWGMTFRIEEQEKAQTVSLEAAIKDFVPRGLVNTLPELAMLAALDAPISGEATLQLATNGDLIGATLDVDLGSGVIAVPSLEDRPLTVDGGHLKLIYNPQARRFDVAPSTVQWSEGRATLVGAITGQSDATGAAQWAFDLRTTDGQISGNEFKVPSVAIEELALRGHYRPDDSTITVSQARLRAGGAQVDATGTITTRVGQQAIDVEGKVGAATAATVKAIWPRLLAPGARRWVGRQITRGNLVGGTFRVALKGGGELAGVSDVDARRVSLTLEASDVSFIPGKALAPIEAPRALLRLEGDNLELTVPEGSVQVQAGRRLALRAGRMLAADVYGERTQGEITFRVQGGVAAAIDVLDQDGMGLGSVTAGLGTEAIEGKVEGNFKIGLPLVRGVDVADLKIEGKARISDGRAKQVLGSYDVQGATINVDIGDKAVDASGQILIGGVAAKVNWQRIFGAPDDKQPPLRVTASLDASDRAQLGLDVNQFVSGDIPVEFTVAKGPRSENQVKVRADLSAAELSIDGLHWRKPSGRQAFLQFDVTRGSRHKTELQNFKLVGDDIAVDGWLALDAKSKLVEFHLPEFSINVVSRVEVQGALRPDNVWDVKLKGATWDGREFFRSLFSVGAANEKQATRKDQPGLDLKAELDTVIGHSEISLRGLRLQMMRRSGKMTSLIARGAIDGGKPIEVGLQTAVNEPRKLVVLTDDAGQAFRMVGFYPNVQSGELRLEVNLDGRGPAEKTGVLAVRGFRVLGDAILSEVAQSPDEQRSAAESGRRAPKRVERQTFSFDYMQAPFLVGCGQFVLNDAELRGPLFGAVLKGKADFKTRFVDVGGTYVPLQGVNGALGGIPVFGQLLAGIKGEGVIGITFRVVGPMDQPQVIVNPFSMLAPGFTRGMFEMTTQNPRVTPCDDKPATEPKPRVQNAPKGGDAVRAPATVVSPRGRPELSGGWSSDIAKPAKK